jgi:hypothetical protein
MTKAILQRQKARAEVRIFHFYQRIPGRDFFTVYRFTTSPNQIAKSRKNPSLRAILLAVVNLFFLPNLKSLQNGFTGTLWI